MSLRVSCNYITFTPEMMKQDVKACPPLPTPATLRIKRQRYTIRSRRIAREEGTEEFDDSPFSQNTHSAGIFPGRCAVWPDLAAARGTGHRAPRNAPRSHGGRQLLLAS